MVVPNHIWLLFHITSSTKFLHKHIFVSGCCPQAYRYEDCTKLRCRGRVLQIQFCVINTPNSGSPRTGPQMRIAPVMHGKSIDALQNSQTFWSTSQCFYTAEHHATGARISLALLRPWTTPPAVDAAWNGVGLFSPREVANGVRARHTEKSDSPFAPAAMMGRILVGVHTGNDAF